MIQVHYIARQEIADRDLFSVALPDFAALPESLSLPSRHFIAFLAADALGVSAPVLAELSRRLLLDGCVYLCAWGPDCERVHDVFDQVCFDIEPIIMTTWHPDETMDEALWYFVSNAFPDDGYCDSTRSSLAISVGRPDWDEHIRTRLANIDSLTKDVLDETQ